MGQIHRGKGNKLQLAPDFPFRHLLGKFNSRGGDVPVIIISGKSGSGKSTLCNIIGLLDKPDQGKVFIKDQEIDYKDSKIAKLLSKNISYLFQNFALIDNKTVGYNLELVYPSKKERKNTNGFP